MKYACTSGMPERHLRRDPGRDAHERAGEHRVLDRVVHVRDRALVEVLGEVERDDVRVAEVRVLLAVRPGAVLAGRLLQPGEREREQGEREQHPQRRPEAAQPERAVPPPADRRSHRWPPGPPGRPGTAGTAAARPPPGPAVRGRPARAGPAAAPGSRREPGGNGGPVRVRVGFGVGDLLGVGVGSVGSVDAGSATAWTATAGSARRVRCRRRGRRRRRRRRRPWLAVICGAGRSAGLTSTWSVSSSSGVPAR